MLSETWVREYVAHVAEMIRLMDVTRETLGNNALVQFHRAERVVREATAEGQKQLSRGTLVMYDPESGEAWKRRAEEYAEQVMAMRDLQRGFVIPTGSTAAEALAAQESVVDALTTVLLLPDVPPAPEPQEGSAS